MKSFNIFTKMQVEKETQITVRHMVAARQKIGETDFDSLWKEIANLPVPEWLLTAGSEKEQGFSVKEWVICSVKAAKEKSSEAAGLFDMAGKVAMDSQCPPELQELAKDLRAILGGNLEVDLSNLPPELAGLVQQALGEE